jgi:GWxTD domain-containing protein
MHFSEPGPTFMFRRIFRLLLTFMLVLATAASALAVSKKDLQNLPPTYRSWLERDVCYIITNEERDAFVRLTTDAERDKFIDHFWEIRNPNPGSPTNTYKEEIYRRIAYADQWYGHFDGGEGWRTDRGRVYITLGAPKQVGRYLGFANIRPMEIWFYSNDHPALPPFFYVVFYQRENGSEFRLYSPYMDGPGKLVTGSTENDRLASWKQIDHDAGREVSRTVLSLYPNEPVDTEGATSSLASDVMLNTIRGLANNPLNKELLDTRRKLLESVSHRVVMHGDYLDVLTVPLVDETGETNLHYLLRLKRPEDFTLQEDEKNRWYYSASVTARVLTPENKLIFSQERKLTQYLDEAQLAKSKHRIFGFEGVLPLPPGKYKIEFRLNNDLAKTSFPNERDVVVPERPVEGMRITDVVPFSAALSDMPSYTPFTVAGVRFVPSIGQGLTLVPGQDLTFFYQLWQSPESQKNQSGNLQVEYNYGRMGLQDTKTIKEELPRNQFDAHGAVVNGKKIPTAEMPIGNYRMSIVVTDPDTHKRTVASFLFTIAGDSRSNAAWDITDPDASEDARQGTREYQRSLCYTFMGDQKQALVFLQKAFRKNPSEENRDKLVNLLYSQAAFKDIAALYSSAGFTHETDAQTVLQMAESLERVGQLDRSIQLLESVLSVKPSGPIYLALAHYYQTAGNSQKASEMETKGRALTAEPAPKS